MLADIGYSSAQPVFQTKLALPIKDINGGGNAYEELTLRKD